MKQPNLIRLSPIPLSSLPHHPCLEDQGMSRPRLAEFLRRALDEAQTLLSATIPETFKVEKKLRPSPPSTATVQLSSRTVPAEKLEPAITGGKRKDEFWVCRKSMHVDAAEAGTASWDEFEQGLRYDHSKNEMAYTPSVTSVETLLEWQDAGEMEGGWRGFEMHVNIITHTFHPTILISPRTFVTCVISAFRPSSGGSSPSIPTSSDLSAPEFLTIQIPVTHTQPADAVPRNISDSNVREKFASTTPPNTIFAFYASVEHVRSLPPHAHHDNHNEGTGQTKGEVGSASRLIEWTMATTSDAGGLIPAWVQRSWTMGGVPRAVVADVGLFLGWVGEKRKKERIVI